MDMYGGPEVQSFLRADVVAAHKDLLAAHKDLLAAHKDLLAAH